MLGYQVEAPRGFFYSPKGSRSRCSFIWKALVAFCLRVHRTVRCTPDTPQCPITFLLRRSRPLAAAVAWHTGQSGAAWRPLAELTWPAADHAPTVGAGQSHWRLGTPDSPVIFSRGAPAITREWLLRPLTSWAPDTVRCTPDSPVLPRLAQNWPTLAKLIFSNFAQLDEFPST